METNKPQPAGPVIDLSAHVDLPDGYFLIWYPHLWCENRRQWIAIAEVQDDRGQVITDESATTAAAAIEWCDGLTPDDIEPPEEDDGDRPWFGFDDREVLS